MQPFIRKRKTFHLCNIPFTLHKFIMCSDYSTELNVCSTCSQHMKRSPHLSLKDKKARGVLFNQLIAGLVYHLLGVFPCGEQYSQVLHLIESRGRCEHIEKSNHLVWMKDEVFQGQFCWRKCVVVSFYSHSHASCV